MSLFDPKRGWDPELLDYLFAAMWARHHKRGRQVDKSLDGALNRMRELGGLKDKPKRTRGRPPGPASKMKEPRTVQGAKDQQALSWMSAKARDEDDVDHFKLARWSLNHNANWRTRPDEPPHDSDIRRLARKFLPEVLARRKTKPRPTRKPTKR